jgi:hypothetical protein
MVAEFCLQSISFIFVGCLTCCKISGHGTDGSTSHPKEAVLRIFIALKIHRPRPGLNPQVLGKTASTILLDHRERHVDS